MRLKTQGLGNKCIILYYFKNAKTVRLCKYTDAASMDHHYGGSPK